MTYVALVIAIGISAFLVAWALARASAIGDHRRGDSRRKGEDPSRERRRGKPRWLPPTRR